jgi:hypothetical protein
MFIMFDHVVAKDEIRLCYIINSFYFLSTCLDVFGIRCLAICLDIFGFSALLVFVVWLYFWMY